jgi:E3 ubiquitin-protein ligase TRIP12
MVKAKAKADRAAARQAAQAPLVAAMMLSAPVDEPSPEVGPPESQTPDVVEDSGANTVVSSKEASPDRTELLRSKPAIVGRFMQLIVPILIDVYAASVITPVRVKTLTGLLKAVSFLDGDGLKRVLTVKLPAFYCYHVAHVCVCSVCSCGELCIVYPVV